MCGESTRVRGTKTGTKTKIMATKCYVSDYRRDAIIAHSSGLSTELIDHVGAQIIYRKLNDRSNRNIVPTLSKVCL